MTKAKFDPTIIDNRHIYNDLVSFLEQNKDEIISFRNSKNTVIEVNGNGKNDTILEKQDCYAFFQGNARYDITNVPDYLKGKLDTIYSRLGINKVKSFEICKDRSIEIRIRYENHENGLVVFHSLLWNSKIERDYSYLDNKDTLLGGRCIYRLGISEEHGH